MKDLINTIVIYYSIVTALAATAMIGIMSVLVWPLLAELLLAASVFTMLLVMSRTLFWIWIDAKTKSRWQEETSYNY